MNKNNLLIIQQNDDVIGAENCPGNLIHLSDIPEHDFEAFKTTELEKFLKAYISTKNIKTIIVLNDGVLTNVLMDTLPIISNSAKINFVEFCPEFDEPCTQFYRYNGNISILDLSSITEYYNFNNPDAQKLYICHNLFDFTF